VHAESDVPLLADRGLACVHAHPHTNLAVLGPVVLGERALRRGGGGNRRFCAGKGDEERVALGVDLLSPGLVHCPPEDVPVLGQGVRVALAEHLEQARRALDVREEEGDGSGRQR
jgi:hypothetical protein